MSEQHRQRNRKPYLLLDAGGTLIFPDFDFLLQQAHLVGITATNEQGLTIYSQIVYEEDTFAHKHGHQPPPGGDIIRDFYHRLGINEETVLKRLSEVATVENQRGNLWKFTFPWLRDTLQILCRRGYRMSVVSNADGRVEEILKEVGIAPYFERIFDSAVVGIEKPDPDIFRLVLDALTLSPEDAIYVGDRVAVDVLGANRAGIPAVHLDPAGLYNDWPGVHIPTLGALPGFLDRYAAAPTAFNLYPCRESPQCAKLPRSPSPEHQHSTS